MVKIKCTIDKENSFKLKPTKEDVPRINKGLLNGQGEYTVKQLAEYIEKGHSFCSGIFKEIDGKLSRKNENWAGTQVMALDFDDGMSLEEFKEISLSFGIPATFIYYTFSHTQEKDKFRAVYSLNSFVEDIRVFNFIQKCLSIIFDNKQDPAAKDPARLFFGASSLASDVDENRSLHIEQLPAILHKKLKVKSAKHYSRNMKHFCEETGINQTNGLPAVFGEMTATSIINNIEVAANSPNNWVIIDTITQKKLFFDFAISEKESRLLHYTKKVKYQINSIVDERIIVERRVNIGALASKCQLVNALESATWLYHDEITHLAMNFIHLEGGEKKLIQWLKNNENHVSLGKVEHFKYYCQYFRDMNYLPSRCHPREECAVGCRYFDTCERSGVNILQQLDVKKGKIKRIESEPAISLFEGEIKLSTAVSKAISSPNDGKIHLIKAPTGIGKTRIYLSHSLDNCAIAVPNHKLAMEVYNRLKEEKPNLKVVYIPEKPFTTPDIDREIFNLYQLGFYKEAHQKFREYANDIASGKKEPESDEHKRAIEEFDYAIKKMHTTNTIIITHERLLYLKAMTHINTVIIDEDIIPTVIKTGVIQASDVDILYSLVASHLTEESLKTFIESVSTSPVKQTLAIPDSNLDYANVVGQLKNKAGLLNSNVIDFITSSSYYHKNEDGSINYVAIRSNLPLDKKYILFSATISPDIAQSVWGNRIILHDIGHIQLAGQVVLHHDRSYSRDSLSRLDLEEFCRELKERHGEEFKVITFKQFVPEFLKEGLKTATTFGATTGLDQFNGENLVIIGTPHLNPIALHLITAALFPDFTDDDRSIQKMEQRLVQRNGFQFHFNTFTNSQQLQNIQFYYIESELVQAIGRARLLRNPATVHLYSNFPVTGCMLEDEMDLNLNPNSEGNLEAS